MCWYLHRQPSHMHDVMAHLLELRRLRPWNCLRRERICHKYRCDLCHGERQREKSLIFRIFLIVMSQHHQHVSGLSSHPMLTLPMLHAGR